MKLSNKSIRPVILTGFATLVSAASSASAAIVLVNPSFESNAVAPNSAAGPGAIGWAGAPWIVDTTTIPNSWFDTLVPDGNQAASLAGSYIEQHLTDNVTGAVTSTVGLQSFDISFFAGVRKPGTASGIRVYLQAFDPTGVSFLGNYAIQDYFSGTDANPSTIDLGITGANWTTSAITLNLTTTGAFPVGSRIGLALGQIGGGESAIDKISITAVPEPAAALLGGLGLLSLLRRRRN